jgi:glycosyltransferase involved in cell wall biosynthesis
MMKVTIVIPVYNSAKYLHRCLESVINQTYGNKEIIVVYDESSDNTLDILHEYQDKITVIDKKSGNMSKALNDGIGAMSGEWFQYVGSDDILFPNATEKLIQEAEKLKDHNYIFYSNYEVIDSEGNILRQFIEPNYNYFDKKNVDVILLDHYFGNFSSSLIHKSLFEKYGLFDELISQLVIDYELWLRFTILHGCRLHLIPEILFQYRQQKESVTQTKLRLCMEENQKMIQNFLLKLDQNIRREYEVRLVKYIKTRPLKQKFVIWIKEVLFKILSTSTQDKIIKLYLNRKSLLK